jgi:putative ABC transport system permease protein
MERLSALAFRNARQRPIRSLLTIAGIILGVAVIVGILVTNQSIYEGFEALFADVAGSAHLTVVPAFDNDDGFDQQALEQVRNVKGVQVAVASTANETMLVLSDREVSLSAYGVDPAIDTQVRPYRIVEGGFLSDNDKHAVVVVQDVADRYDIEVGEDVTLLGADSLEQLLVVGIMAKEGPARRAHMVMPLEVSQEVFARGRDVDAIDIIAEEEIAQSKSSLDQLKATLQNELGPSYEVLYPAARAETIVEALQGISLGLSFFAATALFGGAYLIFNTFSMTVVERTREIGMLRAVGATKGQNFRLILTEAITLGLAGSLLGLLFGLLLAVPMTRMMASGFGVGEIELSIPPHSFSVGFIVGMVVTAASALIPAIHAGRISPVEAIAVRGRGPRSGWIIRRGWIVGLALVVFSELTSYIPIPEETARTGIELTSFLMLLAGVTLLIPLVTRLLERTTRPVTSVIYGNEGRIGSRNINRAMGRTSITVGALTMGVLMFVVLGAQTTSMMSDVRDWMNAALRGDLFVSSFRPMRLRLADDLAQIEGVNRITPMRFQQVKVVGTTTKDGFAAHDDEIGFIAVDPVEYIQISEFEFASGQGDESAMLNQLVEGGAVFIATSIAQRYGIGKDDAIRLRTSRGDQDFLVAGVIIDYIQGGWSVTGTWEDLWRYFRTDKAHLFVVDVAEGVSAESVRQQMEAQYGKRRHIEVESGEVYRDRWLKQMRGIMRLFDALVYIGIVIGALGVMNTMTMNILERIQEIGCLRAVGMTRLQVVKMVLAEALVIGFLGGLFGLAFGAYIAFYAVQGMGQSTGWELSFILPPSLLVVGLLVALGASQVASLYPAWRAAKINIVRAVQYE